MRRITLLALLLLPLLREAGAHPHNAPTVWVDLTVKPGEVIYEITCLAEILNPWVGVPAEIKHPLPPEQQRDALDGARAWFGEHNAVVIDGERVRPDVVSLIRPEEFEGALAEEFAKLTLRYECEGWPRRVDFGWDDFKGALWQDRNIVPVTVKYGNEVDLAQFEVAEPVFIWHAPPDIRKRKVPVAVLAPEQARGWSVPAWSLALLLVGGIAVFRPRGRPRWRAGAAVACFGLAALLWNVRLDFEDVRAAEITIPSEEQAKLIFATLHGNIYGAFEATDEDEIYDLLAVSVDAGLLDELYADIYESLVMRDQGGAVCRVREVEKLGGHVESLPTEPVEVPEFKVRWRWRVYSTVTHWGHTHGRLNRYEAIYTVRHDGRSWKIAAVQVLKHERVDDDPDSDDPLAGIEEIR